MTRLITKKDKNGTSDLLTPLDVMRALKISSPTFYRQVNEGKIPGAFKHGKLWRVVPETFWQALKEKGD